MDSRSLLIRMSCISSFLFLIAWYALWHFGGYAQSERQRAFTVTLLTSIVMTLCSIPILYQASIEGYSSLMVPYSDTTFTLAATCFFITSLVTDLAVGTCFYRAKINLLTGWIHHTFYTVLLVIAVRHHYTRLFVAMCILELPTVWLSIGSVFPSLRRDHLFAALYVPTRIGFHLFMVVVSWPFQSEATAALALVYPLHLYWFYGFIMQQKRIRKGHRKTHLENKGQLPSTATRPKLATVGTTNYLATAQVIHPRDTPQAISVSA
ncbi:hypothetical protein BJV82DRAFT_612984 [Fennellomyces sp. T-0311]|nr:hypothetical protein BJV82DRAFT_612984 [Fennellomyces sp. T-0311]